eukprot:gene6332-6983_t
MFRSRSSSAKRFVSEKVKLLKTEEVFQPSVDVKQLVGELAEGGDFPSAEKVLHLCEQLYWNYSHHPISCRGYLRSAALILARAANAESFGRSGLIESSRTQLLLARVHFHLWANEGIAGDGQHLDLCRRYYQPLMVPSSGEVELQDLVAYMKVLQLVGSMEEAVEFGQSMLLPAYESDRHYPDILFYMGVACKAANRLELAHGYFFEASQLGPPKNFSRLEIMIVLSRLEEQNADFGNDEAYRMLYDYFSKDGLITEDVDYDDWLAHIMLTVADKCSSHQMYSLAAEFYGLALTRDPEAFKKPMLWFRFAKACRRCGRLEDALLAVEQALTKTPKCTQLLLAKELWREGRRSAYFSELLSQDDGNSSFLSLLKDIPCHTPVVTKGAILLQAVARGVAFRFAWQRGIGPRRRLNKKVFGSTHVFLFHRKACSIKAVASPYMSSIRQVTFFDHHSERLSLVKLREPFTPSLRVGAPSRLSLKITCERLLPQFKGDESDPLMEIVELRLRFIDEQLGGFWEKKLTFQALDKDPYLDFTLLEESEVVTDLQRVDLSRFGLAWRGQHFYSVHIVNINDTTEVRFFHLRSCTSTALSFPRELLDRTVDYARRCRRLLDFASGAETVLGEWLRGEMSMVALLKKPNNALLDGSSFVHGDTNFRVRISTAKSCVYIILRKQTDEAGYLGKDRERWNGDSPSYHAGDFLQMLEESEREERRLSQEKDILNTVDEIEEEIVLEKILDVAEDCLNSFMCEEALCDVWGRVFSTLVDDCLTSISIEAALADQILLGLIDEFVLDIGKTILDGETRLELEKGMREKVFDLLLDRLILDAIEDYMSLYALVASSIRRVNRDAVTIIANRMPTTVTISEIPPLALNKREDEEEENKVNKEDKKEVEKEEIAVKEESKEEISEELSVDPPVLAPPPPSLSLSSSSDELVPKRGPITAASVECEDEEEDEEELIAPPVYHKINSLTNSYDKDDEASSQQPSLSVLLRRAVKHQPLSSSLASIHNLPLDTTWPTLNHINNLDESACVYDLKQQLLERSSRQSEDSLSVLSKRSVFLPNIRNKPKLHQSAQKTKKIVFNSHYNPLQDKDDESSVGMSLSSASWSQGRFNIERSIQSGELFGLSRLTNDKDSLSGSCDQEDGLFIQSVKYIQRLGYVPTVELRGLRPQRRPWAYAAYWQRLLQDFLGRHVMNIAHGMDNTRETTLSHRPPFYVLRKLLRTLQKALSTSTTIYPVPSTHDDIAAARRGTVLTVEEMLCALAETKESVGEVLSRLNDSAMGFLSEIQLACGSLNVRSIVCGFPGGAELLDPNTWLSKELDILEFAASTESNKSSPTYVLDSSIPSSPDERSQTCDGSGLLHISAADEDDNNSTMSPISAFGNSSDSLLSLPIPANQVLQKLSRPPTLPSLRDQHKSVSHLIYPHLDLDLSSPLVQHRATKVSLPASPSTVGESVGKDGLQTHSSRLSHPNLNRKFTFKKWSSGNLGEIDSSSHAPSLDSKKSFRVHDQLVDDLLEEYANQPVVVMSRKDALRALQEQNVLKSNKKYLKDPIKRRLKEN